MEIVGGNPNATPVGQDRLPGIVNYFIGNDPNQWYTNIPTFGRVEYQDVYPGIDLAYYGNQSPDREGAGLEYDFIVSPGADPNAITLNFAGADSAELNPDGDLVLHTAAGDVVQQRPLTYQDLGAERQEIPSRYVADGTQVRFDVGAYDASRPLVIDPLVLGYSTYLGGGGTFDAAYDIAADDSGHAYVTGETRSVKFPSTAGAFDESYNGGTNDVFVAKLNGDGSGLVYATFLGGIRGDQGGAIVVDTDGNAYVTGGTWSDDFPTTPGAFDETYDGTGSTADVFVTKLNAAGNALVYSTYLGGADSDGANEIAVDGTGAAYLAGSTSSITFPTTPEAFDTSYNGGTTDAFAVKLDPSGNALIYSTFLGGSDDDNGIGIGVNADGTAYLTGSTGSLDFPTSLGAFDQTYNGDVVDGFVTKFDARASTLIYSTFLGGEKMTAATVLPSMLTATRT